MLAARVRKGLRLAILRYGKWRVSRISLRKLDMHSNCNCILGQLEGDYLRGKRAVGLEDEHGKDYGFSFSAGETDTIPNAWDKLDTLWARAIRRLRGE